MPLILKFIKSICTFSKLYIVLIKVIIAAIKHHDQSNLGRKFGLHYDITVHELKKSGQYLKQGRNMEWAADAEAMEGGSLQGCSSWLVQPAFLRNPGPQFRDGTTCSGLNLPASVTNY